MNNTTELVIQEMNKAIKKFPTWPDDPLHAIAILGEEFGELTQAVLQNVYEPHKSSRDHIYEEALQTAAMAIRFVDSLDRYKFEKGTQHNV